MTTEKPRLASLTKYIPYPGIAHAGGQYLRAHYRALADRYAITALAPENAVNRAAAAASDLDDVRLLAGEGVFRRGRWKVLGDLEAAWAGSAINRHVRLAARRGDLEWDVLSSASVVEFQWSESFALAGAVKARLGATPLVGIAHDVITQRWERAADASAWPLRIAYAAAARRSRSREARDMSHLSTVIVFSEKDAEMVRRIAPGTRTDIVAPGLWDGDTKYRQERPADARTVLFTGALGRPDNESAVLWFLSEAWPSIRHRVPDAEFVVAGGGARPRLLRAIEKAPGARATGFVDSLDPYYDDAAVFVVPLFTGAGVKFKTIDALLRGVPIVSTPVGVEGIAAAEQYCRVEQEAAGFAAAVVTQLLSADTGLKVAERAAVWARSAYNVRTFADRLAEVYSDVDR